MVTMQDSAANYVRHRYVHLRALITSARAAELAAAVRRRGRWQEYTGHHSTHDVSALQRFFEATTENVLRIIRRSGEPAQVEHWVNRYGVGEAIFPHVDRVPKARVAGAVLVVCLVAPPPANGGTLVLAAGDGEVSVLLRTGDGLLFDGANIKHWTTPLEPTAEVPKPQRMVAVGRYYVGTGGP